MDKEDEKKEQRPSDAEMWRVKTKETSRANERGETSQYTSASSSGVTKDMGDSGGGYSPCATASSCANGGNEGGRSGAPRFNDGIEG